VDWATKQANGCDAHQSAFVPYEPLGTLKSIARDVWVADGPELRFGYLGFELPVPTRMTVVRLRGGELFLHSPIVFSPALARELEAVGRVRYLIAPNTLHYWWIPEWKANFPEARVYAAPGLEQKAKRNVGIDFVLGTQPPLAWRGQIEQVVCLGDALNEVDFFHRASRTLILTDLIENFELDRVKCWALRGLLRLVGAADPNGGAPLDMRWTFRHQRTALRAAVERMLAWEPERVLLAHGRWYPRDAATELRRAFRWVLEC
jgi:hypothetical protein